MKLKVLELFGGIGACSKALERLGIDCEIADYVEIDKYAVKSFNAIHNTNFEPQDICEWNKDIEVDLIMHGSPCQDFSLVGKQAGGDEGSGTRSSLMYETIRIVEKLKPKYVIWENVKNLLSKKHIHNFNAYLEKMDELGYTNYYQVLNAKNYGIPQNRERVFTVSILGNTNYEFPKETKLEKIPLDFIEENADKKYDLTDKNIKTYQREFGSKGKELNLYEPIPTLTASMETGGGNVPYFVFPPKQELKLKLKDILEDEVDEKYYLSEALIKNITHVDTKESNELKPQVLAGIGEKNSNNNTQWYQQNRIYNNNIAISVTTSYNPYYKVNNATKKSYQEAYEGDGVNISSRMKYQRGNVQKGMIQTITTAGGNERGVAINEKIRKLTPKECWRLMGFNDEDYERASKVNSNTQLYKQAGNSIVVNVLEAILTNLLK